MTSRLAGIAIARATSIARLMSFCTISRLLGEMATNPLLFSEAIWLPAIPTYAVVIFLPERRSARSSAAAIEVTVSSIFTTTPRRKPCEGQVPTPTIFSFPSRSSSPTRTQIFVVPTSIPTITRSCTIYAPYQAVQVWDAFLRLFQCKDWAQAKAQVNGRPVPGDGPFQGDRKGRPYIYDY